MDIELVLDLAHDLLDHVLEGHEPGDAAELVDDDGHVVARAAKLAFERVQPLALGHEQRGAHQGAHVELGRAPELEQVLGQQDADDVVTLALVHREARVRGAQHLGHELVERRVDVQHVHARRGHHHVAGRHLGHAQHAFEHHARVGVDDLVVLRLGQGGDELGGGVGPRVEELDEALQERALVLLFGGTRGIGVGHGLVGQDVRW
ncbi:hypothetical protein ALISP_6133 [Alicycliphilus sp. B1]|nr:hypothetical protein ALISP_6133 [Alicycliphilus sp. B1]